MPHQITRFKRTLLAGFILTAISACSSTPEKPDTPTPVFPPPPAEARFIYEGSLRSSANITEPSLGDKIREVATGSRIVPSGLAKPYGVAAYKGRVYVTDTQQRAIMMFDLNERQVKMIGTEGKGNLLKPLGIDICDGKEIYVADNTAKKIVVFDLDGTYLRSFGSQQDFERPVGIACDPLSEKVYVVDTGGIETESHHLVIFNGKTGKHIQTIGKRGKGKDAFNIPLQVATANNGEIFVVDSGNFRIQRISKDGEFLGGFGSIGRQSGQFSRPKGIATDKDGNIYVVDTAFGNVQIFNNKGQLLLFLGQRGTSGGPAIFSLPAGIDVDETGRIYVVDQFFRKVDIIRPIDSKPFTVFTE